MNTILSVAVSWFAVVIGTALAAMCTVAAVIVIGAAGLRFFI